MIRINDNGNIIDREMTDDEFLQYEIELANAETQRNVETKLAADKAALLSKLGITADEAKLLLS